METTYRDQPVLITASGASTVIRIPCDGPEKDRLRVAWCLISAGAATFGGKRTIKHLGAYFKKTVMTLIESTSDADIRQLAGNWGTTVIYKHRSEISPLAIIALLVGNRTPDASGDFVDAHPGSVDPALQATARLLYGHPVPDCDGPDCGVCRAAHTDDWHIAFKLATGADYELALGALIELYKGGLNDGLMVRAVAPRAMRLSTAAPVALPTAVRAVPGLITRTGTAPVRCGIHNVEIPAVYVAWDDSKFYRADGSWRRHDDVCDSF